MDPVPAEPPTPPPRESRGGLSAAQPSSNRRASYGGRPSPLPSTTPDSSLAPAAPSNAHRRVSSQINTRGSNSTRPPSQRNGGASHPQRTQTTRQPPPAPVGGFRAQMGVPAPEPPNEGVGSRHARVAILPSQIAQNILPEALTSESPVVETSTPRALPGANLERRGSVEDPLEYLRRYDTVVVVDDSSSMEGALWIEAREALSGIADVAARYDSDGIDIYFLNSRLVGKNMRNGTQVKRLFDRVEPRGITPTGEKLEELLLDYLLKLEAAKEAQHDGRTPTGIKPVNFLVITDGAATDDPAPVIAQAAKRLDEGRFPLSQVGVQFVQIGSDRAAAAALQELDDDLAAQHGTRDMVDTVPFSAIGSRLTTDIITKILLGGINRRQDKRQASSTNSNNPFMNNTLRS